jgi:hypothetical protein
MSYNFRQKIQEIQSDECECVGSKCLDFEAQKYETCAECRTARIIVEVEKLAAGMPKPRETNLPGCYSKIHTICEAERNYYSECQAFIRKELQ